MPSWIQKKIAIRGYRRRLAGRLRREYGVQDSYLPEQVEFCIQNEFDVRRFQWIAYTEPPFTALAFAMFCSWDAVQSQYPDRFSEADWAHLKSEVNGSSVGHADQDSSSAAHSHPVASEDLGSAVRPSSSPSADTWEGSDSSSDSNS